VCLFQGEICVASSRVYVQEGIYDEFVKLVVKVKDWVVGDPFDPRVRQGPQVRIEEIMDGFYVVTAS
jgi:coniferyl-aldehyde dehydrogenase